MSLIHDWKGYFERTKEYPPSPLLVKAVPFAARKGKAIDIGAGALKDTRYLLEQGFEVTALDREPAITEMAAALGSKRVRAFASSYADFDFPEREYDIASAMFSLPFNPPESFDDVFARIKRSLTPGGVFCGHLFGERDGWAANPEMTFHTKAQAEALLMDLEIIQFTESERDGTLADGKMKHWHTFNIIARKR
jgi:SAM-dependent methyltransferase